MSFAVCFVVILIRKGKVEVLSAHLDEDTAYAAAADARKEYPRSKVLVEVAVLS